MVEGGFGEGERLYLVPADGTGDVQRLTDAPAYGPALSDDGRYLAYVADAGPAGAVHVRDLLGGEGRPLAPGGCPTFTPDGRIVVGGTRPGRGIWSLDGAGRDAELPGPAEGCARALGDGRFARWDQRAELVMVDGDAERVRASFDGCGLGPVDLDGRGAQMAFTVAYDDDRSGLYTVLVEGDAAPTQVLAGAVYGAAWSPDDGWLATAARDPETERNDLVLVRPDGTDRRNVPTEGPANAPAWGPTPPAG